MASSVLRETTIKPYSTRNSIRRRTSTLLTKQYDKNLSRRMTRRRVPARRRSSRFSYVNSTNSIVSPRSSPGLQRYYSGRCNAGRGLLVQNERSPSTIHCITDKRGRKKQIHLKYEIGQRLIYQDNCKGDADVTVIDVSLDEEFVPVYTIQFPDGSMKDTNQFHLTVAGKECGVSIIGRDKACRASSFSRRCSDRVSNLSRAARNSYLLDRNISTRLCREKTVRIVLRRKSGLSIQKELLQGKIFPRATTSSDVYDTKKMQRKNQDGSKNDRNRRRKFCGIDEFPTHNVVHVMFFHFKILK